MGLKYLFIYKLELNFCVMLFLEMQKMHFLCNVLVKTGVDEYFTGLAYSIQLNNAMLSS